MFGGKGADACSIAILGWSQSPAVHGRLVVPEGPPKVECGSGGAVDRSPADEYGRAGGSCWNVNGDEGAPPDPCWFGPRERRPNEVAGPDDDTRARVGKLGADNECGIVPADGPGEWDADFDDRRGS